MSLMHIIAFSENTDRKQALTFLTFFLRTLWTFMSSKGLWALSHVVCAGESMERKTPTLTRSFTYIIPLSAPYHSGPLQSDPYESSAQQLATRFLASRQLQSCWENLSIIQHLLKISVGWLRLGLVKALEFNNMFSFPWRASLYKIKFIFIC